VTKSTEFDAKATDAVNHGWRVRDLPTGKFVDVLPGFTNFTIPDSNSNGTTAPTTDDYNKHTVFGRLYRSSEYTTWSYGPNVQVPFNNGESIDAKDIVLWYEGYLPHLATDGSAVWHSTGVRLAVNGGGAPPPGGGTQTFSNPTSLSIPDSGKASLYPSTITVAGMSGLITKVVVNLKGLNHTYPDDLDFLLVGPGGQKVNLMSDAGGGFDAVNVNLTLDSTASTSLPDSSQILSSTYRPTNYVSSPSDSFSAPAPSPPYDNTSLGVLNGTSPNGSWQLFVNDDSAGDLGSLANGWEIVITTN
jgi:subtilisin-like proprotein convertase family protein